MPFKKSGKDGTKNTEGRYSTAYRPDTDEFMFWSVHDHPYGRNRAHARAHGAVECGRRFHVDRDRAGRAQTGPFMTADDVIGPGEGPGVDGAPGQGAHQLLDQQFGTHAGRAAA